MQNKSIKKAPTRKVIKIVDLGSHLGAILVDLEVIFENIFRENRNDADTKHRAHAHTHGKQSKAKQMKKKQQL